MQHMRNMHTLEWRPGIFSHICGYVTTQQIIPLHYSSEWFQPRMHSFPSLPLVAANALTCRQTHSSGVTLHTFVVNAMVSGGGGGDSDVRTARPHLPSYQLLWQWGKGENTRDAEIHVGSFLKTTNRIRNNCHTFI